MHISIRPLLESELPLADHIFRQAFGTFIGLPDPNQFGGDAHYIEHHFRADPTAALAALVDGKLVGSNLAINWGSFGFFGPLSVHPDFWHQGIAKYLIAAVMERFTQWGTRHVGLFTFPNSPKHHALYQKFGFWPRFLTCIMAKPIPQVPHRLQGTRYLEMDSDKRSYCLSASFELTNAIYEGLDVSRDICAVHAQKLGDTVWLWDEAGLAGFAVCHYGAGTEAGSNTCYVKFGAVRPGFGAGQRFEQLLDLCEMLGAAEGMSRLVAGVNTGRHEAYRRMIARGFHTEITGVAMQRPNELGYNRPDVFALDDWR
ncbi:MAG: GNAT family N-acetyltransferase [Chroococcidiopsidaceae cyanobacterium CP_BM_RX_35]|nr:GNAT family N-acetyltransferase [Chroococcidiopsidaceae cyanobacterium CP_BM_RX_35]